MRADRSIFIDPSVQPRCCEAWRRGKYLWLPLQHEGGGDGGLLMHLGMSGSLALHVAAPPSPGPHDHVEIVTTQGTLRLTDPRRFGAG